MAILPELGHELYHGIDVLGVGRARVVLGPLQVEGVAIFIEGVDVLLRVFPEWKTGARAPTIVLSSTSVKFIT